MSLMIHPNKPIYDPDADKKTAAVKNGTIYAGPQKEAGTYIPGGRLAAAQKKSMKMILDQFHRDTALDQGLKDRSAHQDDLKQQILDNQKEIAEINESIASYREEFRITDETPKEDYPDQLKQVLSDLETRRSLCQKELDPDNPENLYRQERREQYMISDIKLARLKDDPMYDTQKDAADIMNSALDSSVREFINEARKQADDRAEAIKEETRAHTSEEDTTEDEQLTADREAEKKQTELKKFIEEQHMIDEDALGIAVDQRL